MTPDPVPLPSGRIEDDDAPRATLLVVDDADANITTVLGILDDYDVVPALSGAEALEILTEEPVDLILLDIMMPDMDGYSVCEAIKAQPRLAGIPIIFLTARDDDASIERAYEVGGCDYVIKPLRPRELKARVRFHLRYRRLLERLAYVANHDPLTGAHNRRSFFSRGEALTATTQPLCAIMLDIDHFKQINDTYGHPVGDQVLREISALIADNLPEQAVFGRLGGEEFAVLLPDADIDAAAQLADTLREAVADLSVDHDGRAIRCQMSVGVSSLQQLDVRNIDKLLGIADEALYAAKEGGRNRTVVRRTRAQARSPED